jgi:maleylacetoacetate isomerase
MPRLKLYSVASSSACERVRIVLALKGIEYDYVSIDSIGRASYASVNKQGLMPTLQFDDILISQSLAIVEYLEESFPTPSIFPEAAAVRAQCRAFAQVLVSDIHPIGISRVRRQLEQRFGADESQTMSWYAHWLSAGFKALETELSSGQTHPFVFGDVPSIADATLVPHMRTARRLGHTFELFPKLVKIFAECDRHPAFRAAAPENQPDVIKGL